MIFRSGLALLILGAVALAIFVWFRPARMPAAGQRPSSSYAYDLRTKSWFVVPGGTRWPCPTPSGGQDGIEVVMAKAPDGTLVPVLLSRTEAIATKGVVVEGTVQPGGRFRRLVGEPPGSVWFEEDSPGSAKLFSRINELAAKGYTIDVRPGS